MKVTIYGRSEEPVSRCVECDLAEPESLASLGGSAPGLVDGILSAKARQPMKSLALTLHKRVGQKPRNSTMPSTRNIILPNDITTRSLFPLTRWRVSFPVATSLRSAVWELVMVPTLKQWFASTSRLMQWAEVTEGFSMCKF